MDRFQPFETERCATMRAGRPGAVELLLRADLRERAEPVAPAVARRVLHALAVLRQPSHGRVTAARCGVRGQSQACPAPDGCARPGGDLPQAAPQSANSRARDLPLSAA